MLGETVEATRRTLGSAGIETSALSALVLVGGSSRIPLVTEILQSSFDVQVALDTHPKHDVVLGATRLSASRDLASGPAPAPLQVPPLDRPPADSTHDRAPTADRTDLADAGRRRRIGWVLAPVIMLLAAAVATVVLVRPGPELVDRQDAALRVPTATEPLPQSQIVVAKSRDGNWGIELLDVRSQTAMEPLVSGPEQDSLPVVSPDRRTVAYLRWSADDRYQLRVISTDGGDDRVMFPTLPGGCVDARRPAWSIDNLFALPCKTADGATMLSLLDANGALVRVLDQGNLGDPSFTADGKSVIYWLNLGGKKDGGALYQIAVDGQSPRKQLTRGHDGQDNDPAASPDGTRLAFRRTVGDSMSIVVMSLDGSDPLQTLTRDEVDQDPSWSPDSRLITFKRGPNENADLYVVDSGGGQPEGLVVDDEPDSAPAWTTR